MPKDERRDVESTPIDRSQKDSRARRKSSGIYRLHFDLKVAKNAPEGSGKRRPRFADFDLNAQIMRLRHVKTLPNLAYLAIEYATIAVVVAATITFAEYRSSWNIAWGWNVPVFAVAIVLIGGLQHRLAGLGHESSHYTLVKNKFAGDLLGDLFCMFPILSCIHFYRLFHLAHHQFTNDHERDPDLVNMGRSKFIDRFPMSRNRFVRWFYLRMFSDPVSFARYQWDYLYVNTFGKGGNVYMRGVEGGDGAKTGIRLGTLIGLGFLLGFNALLALLTRNGSTSAIAPAGAAAIAIAIAGAYLIPEAIIYRSPFRQPYSPRLASAIRLCYYTMLIMFLAWLRVRTNGRSALYVLLLWLVPLSSTFSLFLLLRDVYQHANADRGRLTNSRVFFCDPFTRWAVFVYGQDMHVPHHLFPAIPHYRLRKLHELLRSTHDEYASQVVECHGTFNDRGGRTTILDTLTKPRIDHAESVAQRVVD